MTEGKFIHEYGGTLMIHQTIVFVFLLYVSIFNMNAKQETIITETVKVYECPVISSNQHISEINTITLEKSEPLISEEDIQLIALVTMAEAEGESEDGKRLVIDTILNRVDSEEFPDTYYEVIYQRNQFSCILDGRIDRVTVTEEARQLVIEELQEKKNNEVVFFTAGNYSQYGVPLFIEGGHYFSKF